MSSATITASSLPKSYLWFPPEATWREQAIKAVKIFFCVILVIPLLWMAGSYLAGRCVLWKPDLINWEGIDLRAEARGKAYVRSKGVDSPWQYEYFTLAIDGHEVECYLAKRPQFSTKRWTLMTTGQGSWVERLLPTEMERTYSIIDDRELGPTDTQALFGEFLDGIESNALLFNYPFEASRRTLVKTYQIMLDYLVHEKKAEEIIGYGFSLGSLVQGDALRTYKFDQNTRYCFIKHSPPSSIYTGAKDAFFCGRLLGALATFFGWNLQSTSSSQRLERNGIHEIIIEPQNDSLASLAHELQLEKVPYSHKTVFTPPGDHLVMTFPTQDVIEKVNEIFNKNG